MNYNISEVFQKYLQKLSIKQFPTGDGTWRNNINWSSDLIENGKMSEDANLFTVEELKEICNSIPFLKETGWSKDVKDIQAESIQNPSCIDIKRIKQRFKHLRLVDQNICSIDEGAKEFSNLTDLTISANKITDIASHFLPQSLKVLELCGNEIEGLDSLCSDPPLLQHIGLSYNRISTISGYMQPSLWPSLLSLDLSFNYLDDLEAVTTNLSMLPKLRNLMLQGNPLFLFPGYRGYTIDKIKTLNFLDDIRISADERHVFKGMSRLKDLNFDQTILLLRMNDLKGITKKSEELEGPVEDYPKTISKYHVEFDFVPDFHIEDEDMFMSNKDICNHEANPEDETTTISVKVTSEESNRNEQSYQYGTDGDQSVVLKSPEYPITDEEAINIHFKKAVHSRNMKGFHHYLIQSKVAMRVIENRIVISTEPRPPDFEKKTNGLLKDGAKQMGKSRSKIAVSKKDEKDAKPKAGGKNGKKQQQELELYEWSRTNRVVGTTCIELQSLLIEDTSNLEMNCVFQRKHFEPPPVTLATPVPSLDGSMTKKAIGTEMKKRNLNLKETHRGSSRSMSAMKMSRMKMQKEHAENEPINIHNQNESEVPELSMQFSIELLRWNSAKQGVLWSHNPLNKKKVLIT